MNNLKTMINERDFSDEEKLFIEKYDLHIEDFYDGRGETKDERHDNAKRAQKIGFYQIHHVANMVIG